MGRRFHLVQRKNYSRKKAKPSAKPSENPAAIPAGATKKSVLAIQLSDGCIGETGSNVLTLLNNNAIVETRNVAASTLELPPNNQTGSDDDVEIPLA